MDACTMTIQPSTGRRRVLGDASKRLATFCPRYARLASSMACASYAGAWAPRPKIWSAQWTVTPPIALGLKQQENFYTAETQRVLGPLFTGITLDPSLSERMAFADFPWSAMSHGQMIVPQHGIAAVPKQVAQRLTVHLNAEVSAAQHFGWESTTRTPLTRWFWPVPQHVATAFCLNFQATTVRCLTAFVAPPTPVQTSTSSSQRGMGR